MSFSPIVKTLKSSDGVAIYAEAIGDPSKPSIVLVHGVTLSAAAFNGLFSDKRLLEKVYLVRYDLRGHGRSGKPEDAASYASSLFADDYAAVLQAFKPKNPIHLGWSYGCTVAADVCQHLDPNPLSGIVFLAALPYTGAIMGRVGTPKVLGMLPGLTNTTDSALNARTKAEFVDSLFTHPDRISFEDKTSWLGQAVLQPPAVTSIILVRPQDPAKLHEAGRQGLPMLVLNGTADTQVMGDVVAKEMSPYFKNLDVHMVAEGGHALQYEYQDEVVTALLKFVDSVTKKSL